MKQLKVKLSWLKALEAFTDAEVGRLTRGALQYALSGGAPKLNGNERMIWPVAQEDLDRQRNAFDRQSETNKRNVTNRNESYQIVTNRNESLKRESTPPTPPGKETPVPLKKTLSKERAKENSLSPALEQALKDFRDMRNRMRKPMTPLAVDLLVQKLEKLAPGDEEKQVAMLMQSIENGWTGVYELKQDQKPRMSARQQDYYDKWHPACERNGKSSVASLEEIELKLEDLE
jgi:hypothetical protein